MGGLRVDGLGFRSPSGGGIGALRNLVVHYSTLHNMFSTEGFRRIDIVIDFLMYICGFL